MISLAQSVNSYEYHIKRQQAQQWYNRWQQQQLIWYRISQPWPEEQRPAAPTFTDLQGLRNLIESTAVRTVYVMPVKAVLTKAAKPDIAKDPHIAKDPPKSKGFSL